MEALFDCNWKAVSVSLLVIGAAYVGILIHYTCTLNYWKKRKLQCLRPKICLYEAEHMGWQIKGRYQEFKSLGLKHGGLYFLSCPIYIPTCPQYIKNIMQQDFQHFTERGLYYNEKDDPVSASVVTLGGERWRNLRPKLSPAFTLGKIKRIFGILAKCGFEMQKALDGFSKRKRAVNINEIMECYTIDVIGSCAFGLQCNSFANRDSEFRKHAKRALGLSLVQIVNFLFSLCWANLMRRLGYVTFEQKVSRFFKDVVAETVHFRKTNKVVRNDLLQLLIELQDQSEHVHDAKGGGTQSPITLEEVTANVLGFFVAGYETASVTMTFCLYEIASNADVQDKLRDEIDRVLEDYSGEITYDAIMEMKYMNQVLHETLRKYPPFSVITRQCSKDYQIPGTKTVLDKGTYALISVLGLHHDPDYYPQPDRFDPERFSEENRKRIQPFTYLPFGDGPRVCIGARLAMMEMKVGLTVLLQRYRFSLNKSTKLPVKINFFNLITTPKTNIFLNIEKRTDY